MFPNSSNPRVQFLKKLNQKTQLMLDDAQQLHRTAYLVTAF
jgi:hypothetical protein